MGNFNWELFSKYHRPETVAFCRNLEGLAVKEEDFVKDLKALIKLRMPPWKARRIYRFLVGKGVILNK